MLHARLAVPRTCSVPMGAHQWHILRAVCVASSGSAGVRMQERELGACRNLKEEFDVSGSCPSPVLEVRGAVVVQPVSAQVAMVPRAHGWQQGGKGRHFTCQRAVFFMAPRTVPPALGLSDRPLRWELNAAGAEPWASHARGDTLETGCPWHWSIEINY